MQLFTLLTILVTYGTYNTNTYTTYITYNTIRLLILLTILILRLLTMFTAIFSFLLLLFPNNYLQLNDLQLHCKQSLTHRHLQHYLQVRCYTQHDLHYNTTLTIN